MRSSEHFGPCFIAITVTNGLLDDQNCSYIVNIRHNELEIEIEIYLGCASASIFMVIGYLLALCPVGSLQALTEREVVTPVLPDVHAGEGGVVSHHHGDVGHLRTLSTRGMETGDIPFNSGCLIQDLISV